MDLQKLYDKVFAKAEQFGQLSPYSLPCEDLMTIIRMAQQSAKQTTDTLPQPTPDNQTTIERQRATNSRRR